MEYLWRNKDTGEEVTNNSPHNAPSREGMWYRVFQVGVGSVKGAGGSKAKPSIKRVRADRSA